MLFAESLAPADDRRPANDRLLLTYDSRRKSRQRMTLASGEELGYILPAGTVLRGGDRLLATDGRIVEIEAAAEELLEARAGNVLQLLRAAYHLGNRHVPVQLAVDFLYLQPDHVLAQMLVGLGCVVREVEAPFDPEQGAYGTAAHAHNHGRHDAHQPDDDHPSPPHSLARIHEFK
ncbi:MAG: urease accessory protein UreE [Candidatus Accumulibacter sp.]|nr:urease accessory protein UreE [Accumulibacter sp.]